MRIIKKKIDFTLNKEEFLRLLDNLNGNDKEKILKQISNMSLQNNQHIVELFIKTYGSGKEEKIRDFHFLRFDEEGWSEKRFIQNVIFLNNINFQWPSGWNDRIVGTFLITR